MHICVTVTVMVNRTC